MYHYIVKLLVKKSFGLVNEKRFHELVQGMALNVKHTFAGHHTLGGVRNDQAAVLAWLERLGRLNPDLILTINNIYVVGWPHKATAIVRWKANATLINGEAYENHGVHFITLKWGKVTEIYVYEDTQIVVEGLEKQFAAGLSEAKSAQIIS